MIQGTRQIDYHELMAVLNAYRKFEVEVPMLQTSQNKAEYSHKEGNVEFYKHNDNLVSVMDGEVIDSYGNVVNLERLESLPKVSSEHNLTEILSIPGHSQSDIILV